MAKFEVWMEGYSATGNSAPAVKLGEVEAETFRDACATVCFEMKRFDPEGLSVWGCRLYDNEADARKLCG